MEDEKLWPIPPGRRRFTEVDAVPSMSLKAILQGGHFRETFKLKDRRILGTVLTHSFLQLCEGPWLLEEWNKDNIFFLYSPTKRQLLDIHRPYIEANFRDKPTVRRASEAQNMHQYPSILALGVLLLEIEIGKAIEPSSEDCDPITGLPNDNTAWTTLKRTLEDPCVHDDIVSCLKSVIVSCLEPHRFLPRDLNFEHRIFREKLYERVVSPLEQELLSAFKEISLDNLGGLPNTRPLTLSSSLAHFRVTVDTPPQTDNTLSEIHPISTYSTGTSSTAPRGSVHISPNGAPTFQEPRTQEAFCLFDHETIHDERL